MTDDDLPMPWPWRDDLLFSFATLLYAILCIAFACHFVGVYLHHAPTQAIGHNLEQTI